MSQRKPGLLCEYLMQKWSKAMTLAEARILDVGCEKGIISKQLTPYIAGYIGLDFNLDKDERNTHSKRKFVRGRGEEMPFASKTFDIVFFSQSWHLMEDHQKVLQEAKRVLKENGLISILEAAQENENWKSPSLRKGDRSFSPLAYIHKINLLQQAEHYLETQEDFEIVEKQRIEIPVPIIPPQATLNYWTLKPRA